MIDQLAVSWKLLLSSNAPMIWSEHSHSALLILSMPVQSGSQGVEVVTGVGAYGSHVKQQEPSSLSYMSNRILTHKPKLPSKLSSNCIKDKATPKYLPFYAFVYLTLPRSKTHGT